jgi:hypothetical protein
MGSRRLPQTRTEVLAGLVSPPLIYSFSPWCSITQLKATARQAAPSKILLTPVTPSVQERLSSSNGDGDRPKPATATPASVLDSSRRGLPGRPSPPGRQFRGRRDCGPAIRGGSPHEPTSRGARRWEAPVPPIDQPPSVRAAARAPERRGRPRSGTGVGRHQRGRLRPHERPQRSRGGRRIGAAAARRQRHRAAPCGSVWYPFGTGPPGRPCTVDPARKNWKGSSRVLLSRGERI